MRRLRALAIAGLLGSGSVFFGAHVAASPPVPGATGAKVTLHTRVGALHPWLASGALVEASARPIEIIAHDAIARHASWASSLDVRVAKTDVMHDGTRIVRMQQSIAGIPVIGRGARAVVEADGRVTLLTTALESARPSSLVPAVTKLAAEKLARTKLIAAQKSALVIWPMADEGDVRLAWAVVGSTPGLPFRPVTVVDAQSGEIIARWEATRTVAANIYDQNPTSTPTPKPVDVQHDATKAGLENANIVGRNCIDKKTTKEIEGYTLHVCELLSTVTKNAAGDFTDIKPGGGKEPEDAYAELSMYFHANKALTFAEGLGFAAPKEHQLFTIANFRFPQGLEEGDEKKMADPNRPLAPYDNAFYSPSDPLGGVFEVPGDGLWFGQGRKADYAYDGDVVYHEFGHFLVNETVRLVHYAHQDPFGLSIAPTAMNEGTADLFSSFITGDPDVGEYAGAAFGYGSAIRHIEGSDAFPEAITGESHEDSLPFSQSIWGVYGKLAGDKKVLFQKAFMRTLMTAPTGDLGYDDMAKLLQTNVTELVDAETSKALEASFATHGIRMADPRVRTYTGEALRSSSGYLGIGAPGRRAMRATQEFAPGLFQIRYDAPVGSTKITVELQVKHAGGVFGDSGGGGWGGKPYAAKLLAKVGSDPIRFKYSPLKHDAVVGNCVTDDYGAKCDVTVDVLGEAGAKKGPVMLMLGNTGDQDGNFDDIVITTPAPPPPPKTVPDAGAALPETGSVTPALTPDEGGTAAGSGCACATTTSNPEGAGEGVFAAVALTLGIALRRKRALQR